MKPLPDPATGSATGSATGCATTLGGSTPDKSLDGKSLDGKSLEGKAGRTPELRELRYFYHVARTGSFGRAARELNVTQPSVTAQVQKLEQVLGAQLLVRHGRGMTLTPAGASLMDRLDLVFGLLNAPLQQPAVPEHAPGTVSLALPPEVAPLLVPRLLEACEARVPHIKVTLEVGVSASLEEWILDRRVDIAVLQDPPALDELDLEPIMTERLGLVSDVRDTSLDGTEMIRFRHLAGLKLVLPHPRHWMRRLIEDAAFRRGIVLREVLQADDVSLIKEMVRHGLGHAILPYSAVRAEAARGSLSYRPIEQEPLATVHAIASRRDAVSAPLIRDLRSVLRDVMQGLAKSGYWAGATVTAPPSKPGVTPSGEKSAEAHPVTALQRLDAG
jgi:LysR family nitrogen assimilation transcriptional regulator